jgi:hypothetical protein
VQGVYKQMVEAFRSLGVEAVPGPGNLFDPEVHEAIMREENDDVPDGTVLKEFRRGFRLGNQLLRAAMVQVSSQICKACSGRAHVQRSARAEQSLCQKRPVCPAARVVLMQWLACYLSETLALRFRQEAGTRMPR